MNAVILRSETGKEHELSPAQVLCNDILLPGETHPHDVCLFVIGNEYGALAAAWGCCLQDSLDEAVNADLLDRLLLDNEYVKELEEEGEDIANEAIIRLGNAGEPFDAVHIWARECPIDKQPLATLLAFAEARGASADTLDGI